MKRLAAGFGLLALSLVPLQGAAEKSIFSEISPAELALKADPLQPGADAVVLFQSVFSNHRDGYEEFHTRIKILTPEGRRFADVEILHIEGVLEVTQLNARTILPDGSAVPFEGEVFDKLVAGDRDGEVLFKTLAMPAVEVGSIVEYRFRLERKAYFPPLPWLIQREISVLKGRYSVKQMRHASRSRTNLNWSYRLPEDSVLELQDDGETRVLEIDNVPPNPEEAYSPPGDLPGYHVRFFYFYSKLTAETIDAYWAEVAIRLAEEEEDFIRDDKGIDGVVRSLTEDSAEGRLRALYTHAQQLTNLDYEGPTTLKERDRQDVKRNRGVDDVLKRGYGTGGDINRTFVALARKAGFDALVVKVRSRREGLFLKNLPDDSQLDTPLVRVRLGSSWLFLDPATRSCPFGFLPWDSAAARGIAVLDPDSSAPIYVSTPAPESGGAATRRRFSLELREDGSLAGSLHVEFGRQQSLQRRLSAVRLEASNRGQMLIREVERSLPAGARVELRGTSGWDLAEAPLAAQFDVELPGVAVSTGTRLVVPLNFAGADRAYPFQRSSERVNPIHFSYPWQEIDEILISLPAGYAIEDFSSDSTLSGESVEYRLAASEEGGRLRVDRFLRVEGTLYQPEAYPRFRRFFRLVKNGDDKYAVLQREN